MEKKEFTSRTGKKNTEFRKMAGDTHHTPNYQMNRNRDIQRLAKHTKSDLERHRRAGLNLLKPMPNQL